MARPLSKLYDAFPTLAGARAAAKDLNRMGRFTGCPHGPGARAGKLRGGAQDSGRLKYGVYVRKSCNI
jgi:hypothetical protein